MANNPALELASTLQSTHINRSPDLRYDANPSTAASQKAPVRFRSHPRRSSSSSSLDVSSGSEIPLSILEPVPRKSTLPPLPDMRFEQSYLARIKPYSHPADGSPPRYYQVAWITFFDNVLMPLVQGLGWNLVLHGWRTWHGATKFQGRGFGAKVRRWWWGVNNWKLPNEPAVFPSPGVNLAEQKMASKFGESYEAEFDIAAGN